MLRSLETKNKHRIKRTLQGSDGQCKRSEWQMIVFLQNVEGLQAEKTIKDELVKKLKTKLI